MKKYMWTGLLILVLLTACGQRTGNDKDFLTDLAEGLEQACSLYDEEFILTEQIDSEELHARVQAEYLAEANALRREYTFSDETLAPLAEEYLTIIRELAAEPENITEEQTARRNDLSLRKAVLLYLLTEECGFTVDESCQKAFHNIWVTGGYFYEKDTISAALEPMFDQVVLTAKAGGVYTLEATNFSEADLTYVRMIFCFYDEDGEEIENGYSDYSGPDEWAAGETISVEITPAQDFSRVEMAVSFFGPFSRAHLGSSASTECYEIAFTE